MNEAKERLKNCSPQVATKGTPVISNDPRAGSCVDIQRGTPRARFMYINKLRNASRPCSGMDIKYRASLQKDEMEDKYTCQARIRHAYKLRQGSDIDIN